MSRIFVGFGFGAIQGGLFLSEAWRSGNFDRLVVSEIDPDLVADLKSSGGVYFNNIAGSKEVRKEKIEGVEIYNPMILGEREELVDLIASASELCTALPSYELYDAGPDSVARILAEGLSRKNADSSMPAAVVYAAENDSRAASRLENACLKYSTEGVFKRVVFSDTVIAKMCSVVTDKNRIRDENLELLTPGSSRALLVEAFDQILIEDRTPTGFERGLNHFVEKSDLEPFATAKFFGHNAIHATLGYLANEAGISFMHDLKKSPELLDYGMRAFIEESGAGIRNRFSENEDPLFSEVGFIAYAEDAVNRMINPFLRDPVSRIIRDPARKLGWNDRIIGAMRMSQKADKRPLLLARGAHLALQKECTEKGMTNLGDALDKIWEDFSDKEIGYFRDLVLNPF